MDRAESERLIRKYVKDNNLKETEVRSLLRAMVHFNFYLFLFVFQNNILYSTVTRHISRTAFDAREKKYSWSVK